MKKDLNILKYKDVSVKTSSSQKNIFFIIIAVGILVVALFGFLFFKTTSNLEKLENEQKVLKDKNEELKIDLKRYNLGKVDKDIEKTNKELKTNKNIVDNIESHQETLRYGILQDIIEKPDGYGIKSDYRNLLVPGLNKKSYIRLKATPVYEIELSEFRVSLNWVIFVPKLDKTPGNNTITNIFDENYALNVYRKYLQELLVEPTKSNDQELVRINGFKQSDYSGSESIDSGSESTDSNYDKYEFIASISINSSDYNAVINKLNEIYA